jgi:co-chaperonin GroES (HSP10)
MKALQDCIIIERDVEKHPLFVLPSEKLGTGIAIAIGPNCLDIKLGDHVYFDVGQEFKQNGKEYVVMREPDVIGVFNG